jgi:hypothetical protein
MRRNLVFPGGININNVFPQLVEVARQLLAIPAANVEAERTFSSGSDVVTDHRGNLSEYSVTSQVSVKVGVLNPKFNKT